MPLRNLKHSVLLFAAFVVFMGAAASQAAQIGTVTRIQNAVSIVQDGDELPVNVGTIVHDNDELQTGNDGRVEVTLIDETVLTLGENGRMRVDEFVFDPQNDTGSAFVSALKGPFRFVTGKFGKLANKTAEIRTPLALIGIRGTDFWGGPVRGVYGVFLLDGSVSVTNQAGEEVLDTPGTGVNLTAAVEPPGAVSTWAQDKVDEAISSITFN